MEKNEETQKEFINQLFGLIEKMGFEMTEKYLEEINQHTLLYLQEGTKEKYCEEYLLYLTTGGRNIRVRNLQKLLSALDLNVKYSKFPNWFVYGFHMELNTDEDVGNKWIRHHLGITDLQGQNSICRNLKEYDFPNGEELLFVGEKENEEYQLLNIFHPEKAETLKQRTLKKHFRQVVKDVNENHILKKWNQEIRFLIEKNFDVIKK